ncbi:Uncharacterised protein [Mycobacterium tuberculosis]|nr:Uncharacterised protein [Mycobacterium tuberculosis]
MSTKPIARCSAATAAASRHAAASRSVQVVCPATGFETLLTNAPR